MTTDKIKRNIENLNRNGRPKGSPNKVTKQFRDTIQQLLENNSENVEKWLTEVAVGNEDNKPDPKGALDMLAKLAEFAAPKLARTELVGDADQPVVHKVYKWKD